MTMIKTKKQVIIGLSGGIDSATAAYRLKNEGYEVIGVTFNFFNEEKMLKTAARVADQLGISHLVINAQSRFRKNVIEPFIDGYKSGRTPNPCMFCNQRLKFKLLLETAADYHNAKIATG
ncbi:MAG: 7-cyano-7-deazaguanine synthase, partial [Eubacteriaceae bacterium]|nr:7-cyano-7-deazaguanine synthase [Eubacteriaceae bacterium]